MLSSLTITTTGRVNKMALVGDVSDQSSRQPRKAGTQISLFNIEVWPRGKQSAMPEWRCELDAENLEQAYMIGGKRFHAERPDLDPEAYIIKASGYLE